MALLLLLATACQEDGGVSVSSKPVPSPTPVPSEPKEGDMISFASSWQEEEQITRATLPLQQDFTVFGYKSEATTPLLVFDGYAVHYTANSTNTSEDNTHGYGYVGGTSLNGISQTIKYWDYSADEYHFWACTDPYSFTAGSSGIIDGTCLRIPVILTTEEPVDRPLYSELYCRKTVSSDVVQLRFKHAYSRVRVLFYSGEPIPAGSSIKVTDITFGPKQNAESPLANKIYLDGTLRVGYAKQCSSPDKEDVTLQISSSANTWPDLSFNNVTLDKTHGTSSDNAVAALTPDGQYYYYPLPMAEKVEYGTDLVDLKNPAFVLSANVDGYSKSTTVPANFMQWKLNTNYTYIFKIIDGGNAIEFVDAFIDPWSYGGSQEEVWKNW